MSYSNKVLALAQAAGFPNRALSEGDISGLTADKILIGYSAVAIIFHTGYLVIQLTGGEDPEIGGEIFVGGDFSPGAFLHAGYITQQQWDQILAEERVESDKRLSQHQWDQYAALKQMVDDGRLRPPQQDPPPGGQHRLF